MPPLDEITALRTKAAQSIGEKDLTRVGGKFVTEARLGADLGRLFAVAESYPTLKSDAPMVEAQRSYQEIETKIAAARRFYNSAVGDFRNVTQIFPGSLLAGLAGIGRLPPFFEAVEASRATVDASAYTSIARHRRTSRSCKIG